MSWVLVAFGAYFVITLIDQTVEIRRKNSYLWLAAIRLVVSFGATVVAGHLHQWYGAVGIAGVTLLLKRLDHYLLMVGDQAFNEIRRRL